MKEYEREALLEKADREGSFVGVAVPETVELDGEEFALRDYVFEADEDDDVVRVKKLLRRKRTRLRRSLENDEMSYDDGLELVETIAGIDRALTVLEGIGKDEDLNDEQRRKEKADTERWMNFLRKVTGSGDRRR